MRLGRTDLRITRLSLVGTGLGGTCTTDDDIASAVAIRRAFEIGINHVDTAPAYGESERRFGIAVGQMGGLPERVSILTKCRLLLAPEGRFSPEETRASVERSLSRAGSGLRRPAVAHCGRRWKAAPWDGVMFPAYGTLWLPSGRACTAARGFPPREAPRLPRCRKPCG